MSARKTGKKRGKTGAKAARKTRPQASTGQTRATPKTKRPKPQAFPFAAIVGQEEMKLSLLLNIVDPRIGGVLVMGHRGTGKSTTVRALAEVLPMIERINADPYNRSPEQYVAEIKASGKRAPAADSLQTEQVPVPVVDLPLGATEDRVCGTIDIEKALSSGIKAFEPGLLAQANRGFLYIDEVNLLDDHLVDVLLDVAASGRNVVEREGISIRHAARFVLVGSGNPEEGELRPQLLDRFGLYARIVTINDLDARVDIVRRRRAFDDDPAAFFKRWTRAQNKLQRSISAAAERLPGVQLPDAILRDIAGLCMNLDIDGHRGELTITRAATAYAALQGDSEVSREHVRAIVGLALRHRLRKDPLETIDPGERIDRELARVFGEDPDTA